MFNFFKWLSFGLILIGAINWGLLGLFGFDLVAFLFGNMTFWTRTIYILVGISALIYGSMLYVCSRNSTDY